MEFDLVCGHLVCMAVIDVSGSRVKIVLARFAFSHFGFNDLRSFGPFDRLATLASRDLATPADSRSISRVVYYRLPTP